MRRVLAACGCVPSLTRRAAAPHTARLPQRALCLLPHLPAARTAVVGKCCLAGATQLAIPAARTLASGLGCPQYSEGAPQSTRAQYLHPVRPSAYVLQSASLHHKSSPPHPIQLSTSYPALHTSYPALCSGVAVGRDQARVLGGTRAARRLRAARRRRIDLAGCANDGRQPRGLVRLLVARARPVRQHGQSARTRGHCGARMPAQSLSRGLPEVSGPVGLIMRIGRRPLSSTY